MKRLKLLFLLISIFNLNFAFAQQLKVDKIEPPNWWTGMKWNNVQLMVYGENLKSTSAEFEDKSINVKKVFEAESPNYLFIDISIPANLKPGDYKLKLKNDLDEIEVVYPVYQREPTIGKHQGFSNKDVIYLITPDRFANGDITNDVVEGMRNEFDPDEAYSRHGGDIQGMIDHLDYLQELGVTALWINPLVENNTRTSYHGYAATDLYKIDPRFGTNELYKKLVEEAHKHNLKIIFDHVSNHISINHPWMKNLPFSDWVNGSIDNHELTEHFKISFSDPYSVSHTISNTTDGWFTNYMPDLNQKNIFVKNYLIQNMIWWIEYSGLDGIREDTYPYPDQKFLSEWNKAILDEYPGFNIVGEVWVNDETFLSYYQTGNKFKTDFDTYLPALTDFGIYWTYIGYLRGEKRLYDFYEAFAKDFIYADPDNLMTFFDNHDVKRAMYLSKENFDRVKIALFLLLTTRGIPQIYYGTEIGMVGGPDHGTIRTDFPGGFSHHNRNAFKEAERTDIENKIFDYTKTLLHLRKKHEALSTGKLIHFPVKDEIYYYLKTTGKEKLLCVVNNNASNKTLTLTKQENLFRNVHSIIDLATNKKIQFTDKASIELNNMDCKIFLLAEERTDE